MKIIKNITIAAALLISSLASALPAFAEEVILSSLTVSPPTQKIILTPGETYKGSLRISNSNDNKNDLIYSASIGSFSENGGTEQKDDYGTVDHITKTNFNQIMDWIILEKTKGTVPTNATDILNYSIKVPENAPAGGQYATIIIRDESNTGDSNGGNIAVQNVIQFASIIYAEVAGETRESGAVLENTVPSISFGSPLVTSSRVKNSGNVHTDAKYTLEIWPLFSDEEVYTNAEEPKTSLILPETERYNTQEWSEAPMVGIFKVRQTVQIFDSISTIEKIVIICPLWLILIIVFIIVAIVVWLITRSKSRKKSQK